MRPVLIRLLYNQLGMSSRFSRLEARMEALIEGSFARMFSGGIHPRDVALRLARALEDSAAAGIPATRFVVRLNPADVETLLSAHPQLAQLLSTELLNLARETRLTLAKPPAVILVPDPRVNSGTMRVAAEAAETAELSTQSLTPIRPASPPAPHNAFVILDGERTLPLIDSVVSVGRRFDNHIILDDPRVSRAHAQLRLRFGHYVVYDLGSTGGTFVNGKQVEECVLRPGDVISLGGVTLIYGEDAPLPAKRVPLPPGTPGTRPVPPVPGARPTNPTPDE